MNEILARMIYDAFASIEDGEDSYLQTSVAFGNAVTEFLQTYCHVNFVYTGTAPSGTLVTFSDYFNLQGNISFLPVQTFDIWKSSIQDAVVSSMYIADFSQSNVFVSKTFIFDNKSLNLSQNDLKENYHDNENGCLQLWSFISERIMLWLSESFVRYNIPASQLESSGYINITSITFE